MFSLHAIIRKPAHTPEPVMFETNRNSALVFCFVAISFDQPVSTWSQIALDVSFR